MLRHRTAILAGVATIFGLSCSSPTEVSLEVPADVVFVGVITVDAEGRLQGGSVLTDWTPSLPVVSQAGVRTLLVGYTQAQLAKYGDAPLNGEPLREAIGCTGRLPTPAFTALVDANGTRSVPEGLTVPALTTDAVATVCRLPDAPNWAIDVTCFDQRCAPRVSAVSDCTLRFDLVECGGGEARMTFDADGEACIEVLGRTETCREMDDRFSLASATCGGGACNVHIYREARDIERPFDLVPPTRFLDVRRAEPGTLAERSWIAARFLWSGYASAMVVLGDKLIISAWGLFDQCNTNGARFVFVDRETLTTTGAVPTYPCPQALSVDPGGETFVAAYLSEQGWRVGRFDADGRELYSAEAVGAELSVLRDENLRPTVPVWRPSEFLRSPGGDKLWLVMYNALGDEPAEESAAVIELDAETLERTSQEVLDGWFRSYSGVAESAETYVLLSEWSYSLGWFASGGTSSDPEWQIARDTPLRNIHYKVARLTSDRFLVSALGRAPAIIMGRNGEIDRMSHPGGETEQMMVKYFDWNGPIKLGIGLQTVNDGRREAIATLLDTENDRFLPGVWALGEGFPSLFASDERGRHYVVLPWTAEVLRIDPPGVN